MKHTQAEDRLDRGRTPATLGRPEASTPGPIHPSGQGDRIQRWLIWASTSVVGVTGLGYACMRYLMENDDPFTAFNHPMQPWSLDLHILSVPLMLFGFGWFWGTHVLPRLRDRKYPARRSGTSLVFLLALMTFSGCFLQTVSEPLLRATMAWTHGTSGTLFALTMLGHLKRGRRRIREISRAGTPPS